jgi:hypothetical protein
MTILTKIQERAASMGNKASNLVELNALLNNVPSFIPLLDEIIQNHLDQYSPKWRELWKTFQAAQANEKQELKPDAIAALHSLRELITTTFHDHIIQDEGLQQYLQTMKSEGVTACMVRSTGEEDTVDVANPGGNESVFNVEPTSAGISSAIGRVVASYFSEKSLKQRLLSSQSSITGSFFIPVMVQRMIGESPGSIIRSGVMYTHADMACIQAAPGIGAVTDSQLSFDTFFVTNGNTIYSEIAQKPHRFVPQGQELIVTKNPPALKNNAALPPQVVLRLAAMGRKIEHHYGMPMDVEFAYEPQKDMVYLLQARPIPAGNVKHVLPSAIPPDQLALIKEEIKNNRIQAIKTHVVSTGGNAAKVINKPEEVLICNTVQEALHLYLKQKDSPVQVVIVKDIPPGMSHHVAQLNADGIPVLQTNDIRTIRDWVTSKTWPILMDVQHGLILDWSTKMTTGQNTKQALFEAGILKEGLFARPVRPLTAMSPAAMRHGEALRPSLQETHKQLIHAQTFPIQKEKAFTQLLDCIELIEAVKIEGDNTQTFKALNTVRKLFYGMARLFYRRGETSAFFAPAMIACNDIERCLQTAPP